MIMRNAFFFMGLLVAGQALAAASGLTIVDELARNLKHDSKTSRC